jgi:hypothetical protein
LVQLLVSDCKTNHKLLNDANVVVVVVVVAAADPFLTT